ncbi:hypothetical protein ACF06X_18670 [Streptomyces sp. NPDC015346]|uniref:hypothetical protein n=1 Tax=Streptomyces sp. NPDC015346 TaxID=3364954 RepID=UPI0037030677
MLTWTRRLIAITAAFAAIPAVAGCTVPSAGATGISVTADGQPLGVILMCHDHIDGATLHPDDDDPKRLHTGRWKRDQAVTGFTTWPLAMVAGDAADGWTAEKPMGTLDPKQTYRMYGWTTDNSWAAASVSFTTADLAALTPGQVRYEIGDTVSISSIEDFRRTACDHF